jgi:hypothetical protein
MKDGGKVRAGTKEFDKVLRGMLTTKPLSLAAISASIRARRKAKQKEKQVRSSKHWLSNPLIPLASFQDAQI